MCGIAGLAGFGQKADVRRMCAALRHRGPDDEGYYSDGGVSLGMRRLSIIDLAGGRQPMADEAGRYHIIFNGEIYNFRELRQQLLARSHRFSTQSDTEVIVHLYEEQQEACLKQLNGDFAMAVWDEQRQELFLARDRFGVKPLYYWHQDGRFAFASELKALLSLPAVGREVDFQALDAYLSFLYIPAPRSIFKGVCKLPPAHWLKLRKGQVCVQHYWSLPSPPRGGAAGQPPIHEIRAQLSAAVQRRLISDVPLGAFLSGGIDSSAVVAFMQQASAKPVETFSLGFEPPDDTYNELPAARLAAQAFGTNHHEFIVKPDIAALLPAVVEQLDEPLADSSALLSFMISREAKKHVTVALSGIGGDELFGGYPRYLAASLSEPFEHLPLPLRRSLAALAGLIPETATTHNTPGRIKRFLRALPLDAQQRYLSWMAHALPADKHRLYSDAFSDELDAHGAWTNFTQIMQLAEGDYADRVNALDMEVYLPDDLLALADKMSMAHALEVRVPFCDHELVERVASIPMRSRLHGFKLKGLLRLALRGIVPQTLLNRRKQGFMLPLGAWLRGPLAPLCDSLLSAAQVERRGWLRPEAVAQLIHRQRAGENSLSHAVYSLMVLELWCQRYLDGK